MDTEQQKDILVTWLKDAYAMEKFLETTMKGYVKDARDYPILQAKINEHIDITASQAERLKTRIEELGDSVPNAKTIVGEFMAGIQGLGMAMAGDKVIKNALAAFSAEYFEIACYSAIAGAAEKIGDEETVELAEDIIEEEQEMADWAEEHLQELVDEFLEKEE